VTRGGTLAVVLLMAGCARPGAVLVPVEPSVWPIAAPLELREIPYRAVPVGARPITFCAGGDVMLGSNLDTTWARTAQRVAGLPSLFPSPDSLLAPLRPLIGDADVLLVNVEGAIGEGPAPAKCRRGSTRCYAFQQNPEVAEALRWLGDHAVVVGNVANNHAMDAGAAGFAETVQTLQAAGVRVVGSDTVATLVPLPDGDTLAVLGFSVFSAGPDARDLDGLTRLVSRAAAKYARVVVSVHMGAEGRDAQRTPDATEQFLGEDRGNPVAIAHAAVAAGADLVVGHGPHVLRAVEWRGDRLVAYSLGNLVTYGPFSRAEPLDRGALLCAALARDGRVVQADLRATHQVSPGFTYPDPENVAFGLIDSLSSTDFPETGARVVAGMLRRPR
jgi:hypothetical protein